MKIITQCRGITKTGQRCRGKEVSANGYCKHHGGDLEEMKAAREAMAAFRLERAKKRTARMIRRGGKLVRQIKKEMGLKFPQTEFVQK